MEVINQYGTVFLALAIDRARPVDRALARHRQQERPV